MKTENTKSAAPATGSGAAPSTGSGGAPSIRRMAREIGISPGAAHAALRYGKFPVKHGEKVREYMKKHGLEAKICNRKETAVIRKQILLPKTRAAFGMAADPFSAEPRCAEDMYMNAAFSLASEALYICARHGGMAALIGESGAGKSALRRLLLDRFRRESLPIVTVEPYVIGMDDSARGAPLKAAHIAEAVLYALSPSARPPRSPEARFRALHRALAESSRAGRRHALLIEEAHALHPATLKRLKRFYELEDGFTRLLSVILFGQTELKARLSENDASVREVTQRMELYELPPLDDPAAYARLRCERAGVDFGRVFAPDALAAFRGKKALAPLALNNLCIAACNLAAALGMERVTADVAARV